MRDSPDGSVIDAASISWPAPPNLATEGVKTLELPVGDLKSGMGHIIENHSPMGTNTAGESVFDSLVMLNFDVFLQAGLPFGKVQSQPPGALAIEVRAIAEIGADRDGVRTHDFRVVIFETPSLGPGGYNVITAFPIKEGTAGQFKR